MYFSLRTMIRAALVSLLALSGFAQAHGDAAHARKAVPLEKEQKDWGIAGDAKAVTRTIEVGMSDDMRFTPARIVVRQGETIRFVHRNGGAMLHEFVLGTKKDLQAHAALMKKFPNMEHDEPHMAHVGAGKTVEMIWTFNRGGRFEFACLIPGHYEAGMHGLVEVVDPKLVLDSSSADGAPAR